MAGEAREQRAAQNEDMFRQVNDRLHVLAVIDGSSEPLERFVCECAQASCSLVVELTPGEYRSVRAEDTRFLVFPEALHTNSELETVVERHDLFWVVEKRGEAGEEAEYLADQGPKVL